MRKTIPWTRGERIVRWSVFGGLFVLAALTLWFSLREESGAPELQAGSDLFLSLKRLKPGPLFLSRYRIDPSTTTPVAVQKGFDGIIRAALASCRACPKSRNYEWSGRLICGHCQHVMKMPEPGTRPDAKKPGCVLASLAYSIAGDELLVRSETIEAEFTQQFTPVTQGGSSK